MKNKDWHELIKKYRIDLKTLIDTDKHLAKTQKALTRLSTDITNDIQTNQKPQNKD